MVPTGSWLKVGYVRAVVPVPHAEARTVASASDINRRQHDGPPPARLVQDRPSRLPAPDATSALRNDTTSAVGQTQRCPIGQSESGCSQLADVGVLQSVGCSMWLRWRGKRCNPGMDGLRFVAAIQVVDIQ